MSVVGVCVCVHRSFHVLHNANIISRPPQRKHQYAPVRTPERAGAKAVAEATRAAKATVRMLTELVFELPSSPSFYSANRLYEKMTSLIFF